MKTVREWISVTVVRSPRLIVVLSIFAANFVFIILAGLLISWLAPPELENNGFWSIVFNTVAMILGVGGTDTVIEDVGQADVFLVLTCLITVIIGLVVFTGTIIGYMSEIIASFIENADKNTRRLHISDHIVILNWNNRAAEIIYEALHKGTREKLVILSGNERDEVLEDINERISDTLDAEKGFKNRLTIIVREGDPGSAKQLSDISIEHAKTVVILSEKENVRTIKTLLQVAQTVSENGSAENQKIVIEVEDDQTLALVETIMAHKAKTGACSIVPVPVNRILGQIFSQFSIMPELNTVYSALFSNRGAAFFSQPCRDVAQKPDEEAFVTEYLNSHLKALPLTVKTGADGNRCCYYMSDSKAHIRSVEPVPQTGTLRVSLNPDYEMKARHVLMLGHNSKTGAIMEGFDAFREEWKRTDGQEALDVIVIDDEATLEKQEYFKAYPCVKKVIAADIFEKDLICGAIDGFISAHRENGCIMILSDDTETDEDIDADALTYLILVQDIINSRAANDPDFDAGSVEMIVEIINPKNYDIVSGYSANNIVISNRYISKIIMQVGEKDSLFDLYYEILTFDEPGEDTVPSKELYIKKAGAFFSEIPPPCTAAELIRAVYHASPDENKSVVLGYFRADGEMRLFGGKQTDIQVALSGEDQLIIFSNH